MESDFEFDLRDQVGRFFVGRCLINDCPGRVRAVLDELEFVPLFVRGRPARDQVEYHGLSPQFIPIKNGSKSPLYEIWVWDGETLEVVAQEVEESVVVSDPPKKWAGDNVESLSAGALSKDSRETGGHP